MIITIKYFGFFCELAGRKEESMVVEGSELAVADLLAQLATLHGVRLTNTLMDPRTAIVREGCVLLLNDRKSNLAEQLRDGDVLTLLPVFAGGGRNSQIA